MWDWEHSLRARGGQKASPLRLPVTLIINNYHRNYNEGDQDLLVVKLALKECNESMKLLFQLRGIIY